jgi:ribosomal protein L11 methyltransferase
MQPDTKHNTIDSKPISERILEWVSESSSKITPVGLKNILARKYGLETNQIKTLIKDLVAKRELTYTYEHGCTFVQKSFSKPVRISKSVILKPAGFQYRRQPHDVVIQIKPGASFGDGRHPTTRLAIKGIEFVLKELKPFELNRESTVLDVGTGSGVRCHELAGLMAVYTAAHFECIWTAEECDWAGIVIKKG